MVWTVIVAALAAVVAVGCAALAALHGVGAGRSGRAARLLSLYPREWRARYGEEFAVMLDDTISSGGGGLRLTLNVLRESSAARVPDSGPEGLVGVLHRATHRIPGVPPHSSQRSGGRGRPRHTGRHRPQPHRFEDDSE